MSTNGNQDWIKELSIRLADAKHLKEVYSDQMNWARHFNQLIWMIASIFIPISFAGFALSFTDQNGALQTTVLIVTAIGSCALILFWCLLAQWHRVLWKRVFVFTGLVEAFWQLRNETFDPFKLEKHVLSRVASFDWGLYLRWGLVVVAFIGWGSKIWCATSQPASDGQVWSAWTLWSIGVIIAVIILLHGLISLYRLRKARGKD